MTHSLSAMPNYAKTVREFAMLRQHGAFPEARVLALKAQEKLTWEGTCRVCGATVTGVLAELYKRCPTCETQTEGDPHA